MSRVTLIGCGVIGAMIAYELSQLPELEVCVLDQQPPAQGSTGAALGVLMGIISHKVKGRNWRLRETSLRRYETLIPELEAKLGRSIPFNRQGILSLCFDSAELPRWESLQHIRETQGYPLEIWPPAQIAAACPYLNLSGVAAAIYSPQDRQIDPTALTLALVEAARQQGVSFHFDRQVTGLRPHNGHSLLIETAAGSLEADTVILASGTGSSALTQTLNQAVPIGPVLGQALQLKLAAPLGQIDFQPVVNGNDIHLVPLGGGSYWIGATVEFPTDTDPDWVLGLKLEQERLEEVRQGAIAFCPALADATVTETWFGLRPRPQGQPAPVITQLPGHPQVWVTAGHYRNGVLLAPATALHLREKLAQS
ncbi:FAD-dependent oxidoreductase [Pseudanabaena sp. FACHB-2040]|uniref:NAD(P)/FAD-dependent oxidoreductase n=1 Tax=Pseudanabaena sp. FACHB-2040 TaxID=2692859 RepID=UPI001687900A|nr:FAD-dependent oxidoreductase [Pseudanabaena sp. FACHB-2040]MBD2259275.1 FAD-binding oxidoreductase [Pseudanabaena sp. FACHB-2040]